MDCPFSFGGSYLSHLMVAIVMDYIFLSVVQLCFSLALTKGLNLISNSGHRAVQKLWILQHILIPCLRWPLLIYEIPISVVTKLEQKISCCIRK